MNPKSQINNLLLTQKKTHSGGCAPFTPAWGATAPQTPCLGGLRPPRPPSLDSFELVPIFNSMAFGH
ncbi:MAG: hypothetical protein EZS28_053195 [Streblomastix strix]|uniref:Uncharacterized protein n=1 Tax=Streblomastix strix TaxID=222440 RepID=A0A5J4RJA7_9EUKA|nr:MAG: hypothetical protein EZS28_053195 [Streblomastix strix]